MECLRCINICPSKALKIDKEVSCIRIEKKSALMKDKEKCNDCNICVEICPIGKLTLFAEDCSSCIVCRGKPGCINPTANRVSFFNFIDSIINFMILKIHSVIR